MELKEELIDFLQWYENKMGDGTYDESVIDEYIDLKSINSSSSEARTLPTNEDKEKKCHYSCGFTPSEEVCGEEGLNCAAWHQ